jgi:protease-4
MTRKDIESMIEQLYERFVSVVAEERKMRSEQVRKLADGRIYTSQQAQRTA